MCGDSSMVEQDLFQNQGGGSIPTSPLQCKIFKCKFSEIVDIFRKYHYKGDHIGGGISFCLKLVYNRNTLGGIVVGKLRHDKKYSGLNKEVVELRRMALIDECPKNSESYFLSKCLWYIKKYTNIDEVISYSDQSVGHRGTIYKAANFHLIGKTARSSHVFWKGKRYHPRSLTINRPYSYEMRNGLESGETKIIYGEPKLIFKYIIKRR